MTQPRRIGVLTFHRCFNYGSYWQARCLVEGLNALGHEAELMDHDCIQIARAEGRCLMQPTLPHRSPRTDLPAYKVKGRKFLAAIGQLPLSARFSLYAPEAGPRYDAVVVGSDEVWNFQHPWYGGKSIFFGTNVGAERLISYAASFGNHDAATGIDPWWAEQLGRFNAISVRDDNSRRLVAEALGRAPALVLDPCLQFPSVIPEEREEGAPYAVIYGHGLPAWLADAVRRWADGAGLRLVSLGYRNGWADEQQLDAGPHDFARVMAGAAAVVTNFFHGCVFALRFGRPFVSAPSAYRFNKVRDLAAALEVSERLVEGSTPPDLLTRLLETPPGPAVAARIAALRERSSAFVHAALG